MKISIDGDYIDESGGGGTTPPLTDVLSSGNTITQSQSIADSDNNGLPIVSYNSGWKFNGVASSAETVPNLRYALAESSSTALQDRTTNKYTGSGSSVTFTLPGFEAGKVLDLLVDIDNSANQNDLTIDFAGYGESFAIASSAEDLSELLTVEAGARTRYYITQCSYIVDSLKVLQIESSTVNIPTPWLG